MAKIDIASEIVKEFPDQEFVAEELVADNTEAELIALQESLRAEKASKPLYKLADDKTQYAEGAFTLVGEQEKELPENPSPQLLERIRAGFIVKVE